MSRLIIIILLCLVCAATAFCMAIVEPYGDKHIYPLSSDGKIDKDMEILMNFPGRVYGDHGFFSEIGDWENVYFEGGPQVFNRFLQQYSRLNYKSLVLYVKDNPSVVKQTFGEPVQGNVHFDWYFSRHIPSPESKGEPSVSVELRLGRNIDPEKVIVPPNIEVKSSEGEPDPEVDRFMDRHRKQYSSDLGIYLFKDEITAGNALKAKFGRDALQKKPIISLDDIVWYRWEDHSFELTPEAVKRLPKPGVPGIAFVVMVDEKIVYQGGFMSGISSMSFPGPTIVTDMRPPDDENIYTIDRAYPGATKDQLKNDPRKNPLVKEAFRNAGKLR